MKIETNHYKSVKREADAYNASGTVVVGFHKGWNVSARLMDEGGHEVTTYCEDSTVWSMAVCNLAGWIAERRWYRLNTSPPDELLRLAIEHVSGLRLDEPIDIPGEAGRIGLTEAISLLTQVEPGASTEAILNRFKECEGEAQSALSISGVWGQIECVAAALMECGSLSHGEIKELVLRNVP